MKYLVSNNKRPLSSNFGDSHAHFQIFKYVQAVIPFLVASALSAAAQNNNRLGSGIFDVQAARKAWNDLNPYANPDRYPVAERQEMKELQQKWERFFEFLPLLQASAGIIVTR